MKKCLIAVLVLCLLFSGFTRIENKTPNAFHGSEETTFGGFTVPVPDYYESAGDGTYEYSEDGWGSSAILVIRTDEAASMKAQDFENVLDSMVVKKERTAYEEVTLAGCQAAMADYAGKNGESIRAALLFDKNGRELLFLGCLVESSASYKGYFDDYMTMLGGISLGGTQAAPKASGKGGVSPEVKEFWDAYEAFVDEYVTFMKNPYDLSLLTKLSSYMSKLEELEKKADAYTDSSRCSDADLAYSLEVYARVMQKLASVL